MSEPPEHAAAALSSTAAETLLNSLRLLDPLLQFLTRATGRPLVPIRTLRSAVPGSGSNDAARHMDDIPELARRGVLSVQRGSNADGLAAGGDNDTREGNLDADDAMMVGFPPPPGHFGSGGVDAVSSKAAVPASIVGRGLHGSTKTAAKRRLAALRKSLKDDPPQTPAASSLPSTSSGASASANASTRMSNKLEKKSSVPKSGKRKRPRKEQSAQRVVADDGSAADSGTEVGGKSSGDKKTSSHSRASDSSSSSDSQSKRAKVDGLQTASAAKRLCTRAPVVGGLNKGDECLALDSLRRLFGGSLGCKGDDGTNSVTGVTLPEKPRSGVIGSEKGAITSTEAPERADDDFILQRQAAYAGSHPERRLRYGCLSQSTMDRIPDVLAEALGLDLGNTDSAPRQNSIPDDKSMRRRLYSHQADAIEAVMSGKHTIVCTGTGSGKSLCFLLPVLSAAMNSAPEEKLPQPDRSGGFSKTDAMWNAGDGYTEDSDSGGGVALMMFPTKALAQDQLSKLHSLLKANPTLQRDIRPGAIDGDVSHPQRAAVAKNCNIILTNPDTLHAAILPNWKVYRRLLARIQTVVIDEAHTYEGAFGAHVSLVLSRLVRLCGVASSARAMKRRDIPTFVACSATLTHPEEHFRLLCAIPRETSVFVLTADDDGSPCAPKHFFVWNPTLLDVNGNSTEQVYLPRSTKSGEKETADATTPSKLKQSKKQKLRTRRKLSQKVEGGLGVSTYNSGDQNHSSVHRRHAADETARILARAMAMNVRCIAFCKTRMLVEWVYERCVAVLRSDPNTISLVEKVESYRGGYSAEARRSIEERLFHNKLLGVVGTSALELGVDIGGIDLTLHCGYPGSINSLMQQAGRAGRGGRTDNPSFAIMVCFSSPSEQHIWRHPKGLLSSGISSPPSLPFNSSIVQGHLLCAGEEFPLMGEQSVTDLLNVDQSSNKQHPPDGNRLLTDKELFGSDDGVYFDSLENLFEHGLVCKKHVSVVERLLPSRAGPHFSASRVEVFSTHPSIDKPWKRVSLRCIEPINYSVVDMDHPLQGGKTDAIYDKKAIMDTIPYSRVFYHAFPGAIIMHRGKKFKIQTMSTPPPFLDCSIGYRQQNCSLGAYAKATNVRYSTQALSVNTITVVKQLERVEISTNENSAKKRNKDMPSTNDKHVSLPLLSSGSVAGNGVVTVKREVHGYKKLSHVNRIELSRTRISLPPMEFDTNALWIDTEASTLSSLISEYNAGVHALSHALVAVAPLFVPCASSDLDCDHGRHDCTRVLLFDVRAGGAGTTAQLWKHFFQPDGVLAAAIELLEECPMCTHVVRGYQGGCPGCLQAIPCTNFHQDLSRSAALHIARRMQKRLGESMIQKQSSSTARGVLASTMSNDQARQLTAPSTPKKSRQEKHPTSTRQATPRRQAREKALQNAKDLHAARSRNIIIGRPTWPMDEEGSVGGKHVGVDGAA